MIAPCPQSLASGITALGLGFRPGPLLAKPAESERLGARDRGITRAETQAEEYAKARPAHRHVSTGGYGKIAPIPCGETRPDRIAA